MRGTSVSMNPFLVLVEIILPGLSAYGLATILMSDAAGDRFYQIFVPSAGVSSVPDRLLFWPSFFLVLARSVLTQIHTTMFVINFAKLCRIGHFRARAMAVLAGLRKRAVPVTFFQAVAIVGNYVAVLRPAFRVLDDRADLDLPLILILLAGGATLLLAWTVIIIVCCRLACAVPVLEDASASGFGAMRRRLALIVAGKFFCAAAAVFALLGGGIFAPMAVLMATAFPSYVLVAWTSIPAVMITMMAVMLVAQPMLYLVLWDGYHAYGTGKITLVEY